MKQYKKHKKAKALSRYFKLPMFRASCHIVVCENLADAANKLKLFKDGGDNDSYFKNSAAYCEGFIDGWGLMMFTNKSKINEISHEVVHFSNFLFEKMGYKPNVNNDEFQAYLIGYMSEIVHESIKKYKKIYEK